MKFEKLLKDKLPYHIQNLDTYTKQIPEYKSIPHHTIKPFVGYSFTWFSENEYSEHLKLENLEGFNEDSGTYDFIKGKPVYNYQKEEILFNEYFKDGYVDLKEMFKDLSVELSIINKGIHEYVIHLLQKATHNDSHLSKEEKETFINKLIEWLYTKYMYELSLSKFDLAGDNYFNCMAEVMLFQRKKAAKINYRLNLICYLLRLKKNKGNNSFSSFSKFLDETTILKNTLNRTDIILKAKDLKTNGMSVEDVFHHIKNWLFNDLNFTNDELKYHFGFELHSHLDAHKTFNDFVNRAYRKTLSSK